LSSASTSTRWSVILQVADTDPAVAREALQSLCTIYWQPVYTFVRSRVGHDAESQDLTQEFFAELIATKLIESADRDRGKFRSYLFASLRNFLNKQWEKSRAKKRGGNRLRLSLDYVEQLGMCEPKDSCELDPLYDRQWAEALTAHALARLAEEWRSADKVHTFEGLRPFLTSQASPGLIDQVAQRLKVSAETLRVSIHRLRRRYGQLLREEVARTVLSPEDVDAEIRQLMAVMASR